MSFSKKVNRVSVKRDVLKKGAIDPAIKSTTASYKNAPLFILLKTSLGLKIISLNKSNGLTNKLMSIWYFISSKLIYADLLGPGFGKSPAGKSPSILAPGNSL